MNMSHDITLRNDENKERYKVESICYKILTRREANRRNVYYFHRVKYICFDML